MSIYTVHMPPSMAEKSAPDPERLVFVRDGFSFWAFLLTPAWILWHGLWLVFLGYLVVAVLLAVGLHTIGASTGVMLASAALLSLLVGFEAATLRRLTLARRRWKNVGIVVGDDMESAERRFFDAWVGGALHASASPAATPTVTGPRVTAGGGPASEIIGLFPAPGGSR